MRIPFSLKFHRNGCMLKQTEIREKYMKLLYFRDIGVSKLVKTLETVIYNQINPS